MMEWIGQSGPALRGALRRAAAPASLAVALAVAGCGQQSEPELIAAAGAAIAKKDTNAAIVHLKSALQRNARSAQARYLLGETLLSAGDAPSAVVELEKAKELKYPDREVLPKLAQALMVIGQDKRVTDQYEQTQLDDPRATAALQATVAAAFAAQGRGDRSEAAVKKALEADPKNSEARLLQARLLNGRGQAEQALARVDALIADEPRNRDAWNFKASVLLMAWRADEAATAYKQVLSIDPKFAIAHSALIGISLERRDVAAFKAQFEQMRKALPGHPDTRFFEVEAALIDKNVKLARELAQQLLRAFPENPRVLQLAGTVELTGGSVSAAEIYLAQAVQLQPSVPGARRLLAQAQLRSGQAPRALETLQPLMDRSPDAVALALAGEAYLQSGQLSEAERYFTRASQMKPDEVRARTGLGMTQIAKGNADAGFAALQSQAEKDPGIYADLALIAARMNRNDFANALKDVDRLQGKLGDTALSHHLRGRIQVQLKDSAAARASFEKAVAVDPSYLPAIAGLAELDVADKNVDGAIKRLQALLTREPRNHQARLALAELKQQTGAPPEEVRGLLTEAVKAGPNEVAPRLLLIEYLLARKDASAARVAAQEALAALPDNPRVLDALGRALIATGDVQQAISTLGKVVAIQPKSIAAHMRLAQAQLANKDAASARRTLNRVLEIEPTFLVAQSSLIQMSLAERRPVDALNVARTVQKQRPTDPVGYLFEADVQTNQRRWDQAIAALRAAMDRQKSTSTALRMHAILISAGRSAEADQLAENWLRDDAKDVAFLSYLGSLDMDRRQFARAESRFRAVLAIDANNVNALNNVAWNLVQQGKKGGVSFAEKANELKPEQPALIDTLAAALAAEGQLPQAVTLQRKAVATSRGGPDYRLRLAKLLIESGDRGGARGELTALAKLGPKFPSHAEVTKLLQTL